MTHEFAYPRVRQIAPRAHDVRPSWRAARPTAAAGDPWSSGTPSTDVPPARPAGASPPPRG